MKNYKIIVLYLFNAFTIVNCVLVNDALWKAHGRIANRYLHEKKPVAANNNRKKQFVRQPLVKDGDGLGKLTRTLFEDYDKELLSKRPVAVNVDLLLMQILSTVEREGIFESVVALFVQWTDDRLVWNPEEFDNVTVLAIDPVRLWLPDIAMSNSANHIYDISRDTQFVVRVTNKGLLRWVPTGTARTWCNLDLNKFPFDIQTCSFEFESWSLDTSTMYFVNPAHLIVDDNYRSNQWSLCQKNSTVYNFLYEFTAETFSRIKFSLKVKRKPTFYVVNLIFPCTTLSIIQLLVFAIPSTESSADRILFGTTNLLTLVVFQTIVTTEMPKSSDAVTALSKYIIVLVMISSCGIVESVIAERIRRIKLFSPPPLLMQIAHHHYRLYGMKAFHNGRSRVPIEDVEEMEMAFTTDPDDEKDLKETNSEANSNRKSFMKSNEPFRNKKQPFCDIREYDEVKDEFWYSDPVSEGDVWQRRYVGFPKSFNNSRKVDNLHRWSSNCSLNLRHREPRLSVFESAIDERNRREFVEHYYSRLWNDVAAVIDVLSLIVSSLTALLAPAALFLPILYYGDEICAEPFNEES